jgi:serine/threonine-protein kinase
MGGQGAVYGARDERTGNGVAVKVLTSRDPNAVERMFREAQAMSQLRGLAAVQVIDHVHADDGALALVMELLRGRDLHDVLEDREARGILADRAFLERTLDPIVRTLEAAHQHGIVHRDIKTNNIFVLDDAHGGGVRLLDFGFAKLPRTSKITDIDAIAGSPSYLAPEVWLKGSSSSDPLVDVYAFGVVLFRVVARKLPFSGNSIPDLFGIVTSAPRPSLHALRPDLPRIIDGWVEQVLAVSPAHRFANVTAAWRALLTCF